MDCDWWAWIVPCRSENSDSTAGRVLLNVAGPCLPIGVDLLVASRRAGAALSGGWGRRTSPLIDRPVLLGIVDR